MVRLACLLIPLLVLVGCGRVAAPERSHELVVAIRSGPSSYQVDAGKLGGFEYDLVQAFAESQHLPVRYVVVDDQSQLRSMLRRGKVNFAASIWIDDQAEFLYSTPLRESDQVLIGAADDANLTTEPVDLTGKSVATMFGSPQATVLQHMAGEPPQFVLSVRTGVTEFDLLNDVAARRVQYAATDLLQYKLALHYLPDLEVAFKLPGRVRFGWAFSRNDAKLQQRANQFIHEASAKNGLLARLTDHYFGYIERIKPDGITEFFRHMRSALPRYRRDFQSAQASTGIDWRLLAALAYQESQWDPLATSFTNVRGLMMLTEDTADLLHVTDRLDPAQSIRAGSSYLADLKEQLPDEVKEPDRTWLALAAYNLGMGHLNAARAIAIREKRDPNSWYEMKQVLPLLARPEYYEHLKSGMGRGGEAVIMVENIRTYYDTLSHFEPAWQPGLQPALSLSKPPIQGRKAKGTVTLPSAF
jgi:membrane-bound lytic murein transglycosylase F